MFYVCSAYPIRRSRYRYGQNSKGYARDEQGIDRVQERYKRDIRGVQKRHKRDIKEVCGRVVVG